MGRMYTIAASRFSLQGSSTVSSPPPVCRSAHCNAARRKGANCKMPRQPVAGIWTLPTGRPVLHGVNLGRPRPR